MMISPLYVDPRFLILCACTPLLWAYGAFEYWTRVGVRTEPRRR